LLKKASDAACPLVAAIIAASTGFRDFGISSGRSLVSLGGRTSEAEDGPPVLKTN
jgi:hypothetical protein